jgi:hypothetical protein
MIVNARSLPLSNSTTLTRWNTVGAKALFGLCARYLQLTNSNSHFKTASKGYDEQAHKTTERTLSLTRKATPRKGANRPACFSHFF